MTRHDDRAVRGDDGLDQRLRGDHFVDHRLQVRFALRRERARTKLLFQAGPLVGSRRGAVVHRPQRIPHAIEHRRIGGCRRRDLRGHHATVFVNGQRRGHSPQLERRVQRKQRRRLDFVAKRVAVIDGLRVGQARHQKCLAIGRPRRRATLARHQLRWRRRLRPRRWFFSALGTRRLDGGDPHRANTFAHGIEREANVVRGPRWIGFVATNADDAGGAQRTALGADAGDRRRHRLGGTRAKRRGLGHRRGRHRHPPQVQIVFRVTFRDERDLGAIWRDARIGFAVGGFRQRQRRLPGARASDGLHHEQVPLQAGITATATGAGVAMREHQPAIDGPRRPALVARQGGHGHRHARRHPVLQ